MNQIQNIKDILSAINSVRERARKAMIEGDYQQTGVLMNDLIALELCLVYQTEELVKESA